MIGPGHHTRRVGHEIRGDAPMTGDPAANAAERVRAERASAAQRERRRVDAARVVAAKLTGPGGRHLGGYTLDELIALDEDVRQTAADLLVSPDPPLRTGWREDLHRHRSDRNDRLWGCDSDVERRRPSN